MNIKLKEKSKIYLIYTALFSAIFFIIYFIFLKNGKSFVWSSDGYDQHFAILYNFNEIIRNIFKNGFQTFSWNLGLGIDIIGQYSYYILGDPFAYLSLLFPISKLEYAYAFLIVLRIYFIGISFIKYCKYNNKSMFNTLIGTIMYTFSGFVIYAGVRHPFFMNALILFPLILLGIDKLYKEDKVTLFAVVVAISAIINYYFLYIISVLAFIYAIIKFLCEYKENGYRFLFKKFLKAIMVYIIGVMVAGIILLPTIYAYINSNRLGNAETTKYGMKYYKIIFVGLTSNNSLYWSRICVSSIAILMAPMMLRNLKNRENKTVWFCILIETIMLLFNFFGSFMNGFSFQSNRWVFGYTFLLAYMVVINFKEDFKYNKYDILNMSAMLALYFFGLIVCSQRINIIPSIISVVFAALMLGIIIWSTKNKKIKSAAKYIVFALIIGNIIYYGFDLFSKTGKDYIDEFIKSGKVLSSYDSYNGKIKNYDKAIATIKEKDSGFYRISNNLNKNTNISLIQHYNSIGAYLSVGNKYVGKLCKDINNRAYNSDTNPLRDLDGRTKILTLVGNKYFVAQKSDKIYVPYDYEQIEDVGKKTRIYKNKNNLSIGVFYDNYMLDSEYNELSSLEKEQALLDTAVISEKIANIEHNDNLKEEIKSKTTKNVNYKLLDNDKIINKEKDKKKKDTIKNTITIDKEDQYIELNIGNANKSELYVELKNFKAKFKNKYDVKFTYDKVTKTKNVRDAVDDPYYIKTDSILVNLGYKKQHSGTIRISFDTIGEYTYDEINVISVPMNVYRQSVYKLQETLFNLVNYDNKTIEGNIENFKDGILQISTPYTKGWTAYVDGKEVQTINVNTAFIGIPLKTGKHEIVLKYKTPYLREGIIATVIGIVLLTGLIIIEKNKTKNGEV